MKKWAFVYLGFINRPPFSFIIVIIFFLPSDRFVIDNYSHLPEQDFISFIIFANDPLLAMESKPTALGNLNIKGDKLFCGILVCGGFLP